MDIETSEEKVLSVCDFDVFKPEVICIEVRASNNDLKIPLIRGYNSKAKFEKYLLPYYELKELVPGNAFYTRRKNI